MKRLITSTAAAILCLSLLGCLASCADTAVLARPSENHSVLSEAYSIRYDITFQNINQLNEFYGLFEDEVCKLGYRHTCEVPQWAVISFILGKREKLSAFVEEENPNVKSAFFWHENLEQLHAAITFRYYVSGNSDIRQANIAKIREIGLSICKVLPQLELSMDDYKEMGKSQKSTQRK